MRALNVLADIGVHHHEIGRPQPLTIHVRLEVIPPERDAIDAVFDYVEVKAIAERLARERIVLVETFALRLARECLAHCCVLTAEVSIEKPQGVPGARAGTSVRVADGSRLNLP
nr:dihydroneopterin aldolase [Stakelama flava]